MTLDELRKQDGRDGRPARVALGGTVYDFSASPLWKQGNHEGAHQAGADLTEALKSAPHVRALVERFPVVGHLEAQAPPKRRAGPVPLLLLATLAALLVIWLLK